jgi:RNA polymerase sigma-70 factor (ECF subfamily)
VDDESTVAAYLRTRDPELFRVLVERYEVRVFRLVASVLGPYADLDAQEVAQEIFLRVHEKLGGYRGEARFGSWLYRLAYNRALEQRRQARIRLPHLPLDDATGPAPPDPFELATDGERRRAIARLVERLPALYRSVIYMHYWLECSVEEIADALGVPIGTVKSYLSRARRRLRDDARRGAIAGFD